MLGDWFINARNKLKNAGSEPISSLQAIIQKELDVPPHYHLSHPEYRISHQEKKRLDFYLEELINKKPLAYILNKQEFYGLSFYINQDVLIPRPETEQMILTAVSWLEKKKGIIRAIDIGTGSGCIAISIAKTISNIHFFASDVSFPALSTCKINVIKFGLQEKIDLAQADLLSGFSLRFDCIFANLPYIPEQRLNFLNVSRFEPRIALNGGINGFNLIEKLLIQSSGKIKPDGIILLEIDDSHTEIALRRSREIFPAASIRILNDFSRRPRILQIKT